MLPRREFLQAQQFQVAVVNREAPIQIRVRVDTDHERFRQAVADQEGASEREEFLQQIQVRFFDEKHLGVYLDQEGTITLILKPAKPVPAFDGYASIDLGNTSSTLVSLSLSQAFYRTDSMQLVDADAARGDLRSHVDPVLSHVRIDRIRSYDPPPPGVARVPVRAARRLPANRELGRGPIGQPTRRRCRRHRRDRRAHSAGPSAWSPAKSGRKCRK